MTSEIEWVQIPALKNYEINKDGEVRDIHSKKLQSWGKLYFLYGSVDHPARKSMLEIMRTTFGDDSVDKSNALRTKEATVYDFTSMRWAEIETVFETTRLKNMDKYERRAAFARQKELQTMTEPHHDIVLKKEVGSNRDAEGRWFCSCGDLLTPTSAPRPAMAIHMTELGR